MTNHCGDCSLCCKLLGVAEISKAPHQWCQFRRQGVGCTIHSQPSMPGSCAEYVCLWRQMRDEGRTFPDELRPDRCKVIIDAAKSGDAHYVRADPGYPDAWRRPVVQNILGALADAGSTVYLVTAGQQQKLRVVLRSRRTKEPAAL